MPTFSAIHLDVDDAVLPPPLRGRPVSEALARAARDVIADGPSRLAHVCLSSRRHPTAVYALQEQLDVSVPGGDYVDAMRGQPPIPIDYDLVHPRVFANLNRRAQEAIAAIAAARCIAIEARMVMALHEREPRAIDGGIVRERVVAARALPIDSTWWHPRSAMSAEHENRFAIEFASQPVTIRFSALYYRCEVGVYALHEYAMPGAIILIAPGDIRVGAPGFMTALATRGLERRA